MASKRQTRTGKWEYTIKNAKLLEKPLYLTFDKEKDGDDYVRRLEALLSRGIVPPEIKGEDKPSDLASLIDTYLRNATVKYRDIETLNTLLVRFGSTKLTSLNVLWVDTFVATLKQEFNLAPSTIRAKVGALARCTDWGVRKSMLILPDNPFRTLPRGYSAYSVEDEKAAGEKRKDVERDRRLHDGEFEKILEVIRGGVLERKFRPYVIEDKQAVEDFFILAVETAMRMSEMYTLGKDQVMSGKATVFLNKTKNGDKRNVPLSSVAVPILERRVMECKGTEVFPWWDGGKDRKRVTSDLSKLYSRIFEAAGCGDLHFHDLRHEATSRLFERTNLSGEAIMKITGHRSHAMVMRYLSLRASELAASLW